MEIIFAALVGAIGSIILSLVGVYGAKRAGLGVTQDKLVNNLEGLVSSLEKKSAEQEKTIQSQEKRIMSLETKVNELQELTIQQATFIKKLLSKRKVTIQNNGDEISS